VTPKRILNKIISEDGSCTGWANSSICKVCPLSKLKTREDGTYVSCIEAVGATTCNTLEEADIKYKKMAEKILVDIIAEEHLFEEKDRKD
jgi:hypothetical protein